MSATVGGIIVDLQTIAVCHSSEAVSQKNVVQLQVAVFGVVIVVDLDGVWQLGQFVSLEPLVQKLSIDVGLEVVGSPSAVEIAESDYLLQPCVAIVYVAVEKADLEGSSNYLLLPSAATV